MNKSLNGFPEIDQETANLFLAHPAWDNTGQNSNVAQVRQGIDAFKASFNTVTGKGPANSDVNKYLRNAFYGAWNAPGDLLYTDQTALANNFIQSNYDLSKLQQEKGKEEAPKQFDSVDKAFQELVGRPATQAEKEHFGTLLASGDVDAYSLGEWLKALPEDVKKQDAEFRKSLTSDLQAQDSRYFSEQIMPGIQSAYAKQGRTVDSSGYATALAQAAQGQNLEREGFLSNLTASQYEGNKANAYDAYLNSVQRVQGLQDYSRNRYNQLADTGTQRLYDTQNFNMQKSAYDEFLKRAGKRNYGTLDYVNTAFGGLNALANVGRTVGGWGSGGA